MKNVTKFLSLLLIAILIIMVQANINYVEAASTATGWYVTIDRGPRISATLTNSNYLIFKLADNGGIKSVLVTEYNSETGSYDKEISSSKITLSSDKQTLKIAASVFNTSSYTKIRIRAIDDGSKNQKTYAYYQVKKLSSKNSSGNYYSIKSPATKNTAYSFTNTFCSENGCYINSKANALSEALRIQITKSSGIQTVIAYDLNNNNKILWNDTDIATQMKDDNEKYYYYTPNLSKYKTSNGAYNIQLYVKGTDGTVVKETMTIKVKSKTVSKSKIYNPNSGTFNIMLPAN